MKINEIAPRRLDEAPPGITPAVKYIGPYFDDAAKAAAKAFGVGKGTTQAELDALRAGETGAANAAGGGRRPPTGERPLSTVSSDELNALLYPRRASEPTVGSFFKRRGDPGFDPDLSKTQALPNYLQNMPPARIGSPPKPKPKADTSAADQEVRDRHDMNPGMPNKGKPSAEAEAYAAEKAARAEKQAAEELAAAEKAAAKKAAVELPAGNEPPVTANTTAAPAAPDTVTLPKDVVDRILKMAERDPAAAQAAAEKAGIPWYIPSKGGLALGTAAGLAIGGGPTAINAIRPGTVPDWGNPAAYVSQGPEKVLAPKPLSKDLQDRYPDLIDTTPAPAPSPSSSEKASAATTVEVPAADNTSDTNISDADREARIRELINRKVDESTAALNRMIYLSRL